MNRRKELPFEIALGIRYVLIETGRYVPYLLDVNPEIIFTSAGGLVYRPWAQLSNRKHRKGDFSKRIRSVVRIENRSPAVPK